jgi:hypothetical protein
MSTRTATIEGRRMTLARPDGIASSIERHAAATVTTVLAAPAIESRQPAARSRTQPRPRAVDSRTETESRAARQMSTAQLGSRAASGTSRRRALPVIRQSRPGGGRVDATRNRQNRSSHHPQPEVRHLGPTRDMLGTSMGTTPMVRPSESSDTRSRTRVSKRTGQRPNASNQVAHRAPAASSTRNAPPPAPTRRQALSSRTPRKTDAGKPRQAARAGAHSRNERPRNESDPPASRRRRR